MFRFRSCVIAITVLAFLISGSLLTAGLADGGANHQRRNQHLGVSGGNVNDISKAFCCSGTLGSLVTDGTTQYILSNNHVLARSDQAVAGEDISQPGLIDNSCRVATLVADFTIASPLGSNVDAAIAQLRSGTMDSTGFIEDIGVPTSATVAPSVGLSVAKSGRTTGFTTGTIGSINTSVSVQYQKGCNSGKKFTVSYSNQVVINSSTFSAGGDSGSLIVTNNSSHNPVALLYAGSSSTTIGNPASEVLTKLSTVLGRSLSFVGSGGGGGAGPTLHSPKGQAEPFLRGFGGLMPQLPEQAADRASAVLEVHRANLMATPGVIGAGVGAASENDLQAAIVVYVDRTSSARPQFAPELDGVAVRIVYTDPFVAF
jgi:Peptidase family S64